GLQKLNDEDFREHHLYELLREKGPAERIGEHVFHDRLDTIRPFPAGRDGKKTVLVFSPHPDDDVISMGGTLIRLVEQGHEVHVAYQTSGNIAVFDGDAIRFADFVGEFNRRFNVGAATDKLEQPIEEFIKNKKPGQLDSP